MADIMPVIMPEELSLEQRRVCNSVMINLCLGFYDACLQKLRQHPLLPPMQAEILRNIVLRMMHPKPGEQVEQFHLIEMGKNETILRQLNDRGCEISIPESVLRNIYEQAMELSFENFRTHLLEAQTVEHLRIQQTLILCKTCTNLMLASQKMENMDRSVWFGINESLTILYVMVFIFCTLFYYQLT